MPTLEHLSLAQEIPAYVSQVAVVTATNPVTEQLLTELELPPGMLNEVGAGWTYRGFGRYTTAQGQNPSLRFRLYICTVSGGASGTVVTAADLTSGSTPASVTTNSWNLELFLGTAVAGVNGVLEGRAVLLTQLSAVEVVMDEHDTGSQPIDLRGPLYLRLTVQMSTGNAGNSVTQRLASCGR